MRLENQYGLKEANWALLLFDLLDFLIEIFKRLFMLGTLPTLVCGILEGKRELLSIEIAVVCQLITGRVFLRYEMHFINDF